MILNLITKYIKQSYIQKKYLMSMNFYFLMSWKYFGWKEIIKLKINLILNEIF